MGLSEGDGTIEAAARTQEAVMKIGSWLRWRNKSQGHDNGVSNCTSSRVEVLSSEHVGGFSVMAPGV